MIVILVASMVQGVFAQQIIIKGTVKDATSKKAAEYVNVVLQTADSVFVGGTITNSKGDFLLNKVYAGDYLLALSHCPQLCSFFSPKYLSSIRLRHLSSAVAYSIIALIRVV